MPRYVYGCSNKEHPRVELTHMMMEQPRVICKVCGSVMHRIPQVFQWYNNPFYTLLDQADEGYRKYRERKARQNG